MAIVGFSFSKFNCVRNPVSPEGGIEIKHNINIKGVESSNINLANSQSDVLKVFFSFEVIYSQDLGKVQVDGDVVYADTSEIISEVQKQWDTDKKLNDMVSEVIFKFIYNKTAIKVLELADSLNLPSPIPLPQINFEQGKKE